MTSTIEPPGPASLEEAVNARVARMGGLDIAYDDRVLRPRLWTVAQSQWAAELLATAGPGPVLELCTGAGHIGLLSILGNERGLVAVDADAVACDYARANAVRAGLGDRVEVRHALLDEALRPDERFPMIIADPPWVPSARTTDHPEDPLLAIDGGEDGLAVARRCLDLARTHLAPDGVLLLQLGNLDQASALEGQIEATGLATAEIRQPSPTGVVALVRRAVTHT